MERDEPFFPTLPEWT